MSKTRGTIAYPLRVYIAGRMTHRNLLLKWRKRVQAAGFLCVCLWMDTEEDTAKDEMLDRVAAAKCAQDDLDDLDKADIFILDLQGTGGGGRFFEYGVAYNRGLTICTVGLFPASVFEALVPNFQTWPEVMGWLEEIKHA